MFMRTKPQTLVVDLDGLGALVRDLTASHGPAQFLLGERLRVSLLDSGRFLVRLDREQTRFLLSQLPVTSLVRRYEEAESE